MPNTPKLVIPVEADIKKAAANLAKIKNSSKNTLTGIGKVADGIKKNFLAFGAGITASALAIKKFLGVAAEFEQSIANVASVSGGARKELAALARETGATTVFSAKEAANAMYFLASAGLDVVDMTEVLTPALNLASAAQIDVAEATDITINSLKIFGAEMSDAAKYTDIMATSVQSANTDMPQLGEAIKVAGSTAKLAGVSFEDLNVLIAGMANQGIKGSEAGTKLRQSFARLLKPTAEAQKTLLKYNITQTDIANNIKDPIKLFKLLAPAVENTADATEILGVRQLAVAGLIKNGIPDLVNLKQAMADAGGTAEKMAEEQLNTLQGSIKLLQSAFQEVILSGSGEGGLIDIFRSIVTTLTDLVKGFQNVPGPLKAIIIGIGLLTPAIIALQAALGPVGVAFLGIAAAMTILLPKMVDFESVSSKVKTITDDLTKIQEDYEKVVKRLNDPTKELTKSEKALLEIRKEELELKQEQKLAELVQLNSKLSKTLLQKELAYKKATERVRESTDAIGKAREMEELLNKSKKGDIEAREKLLKLYNSEVGWYGRLSNATQLNTEATIKIAKAKREHKAAVNNLTQAGQKLNSTNAVETSLVDKLAQAYINQREGLNGLKVTEADLFSLGKKINDLTKARVTELDSLTAAQKKNKKEKDQSVKKTKEEVEALEKLSKQQQFLLDAGLATQEELTRMTTDQVNARIEAYKKELEFTAKVIEEGNRLLQSGFEVATSIFDNYMQNKFDRTNIYQDQLDELDKEDRERTKANLKDEIDTLALSDDEKDKSLLEEKKRELKRMELEDEAAKRDKEIKRNEAIANRKMAVAQRIGSAFSIAAETGVAVAKATAASPLTFGQPWAGGAIASGILGAAALFSKPLPPIPALAKGGDFETKGPMLALLGDNPSGRERVKVEPLQSYQNNDNSTSSSSSITIEKLEVLSNDPEDVFNKVYEYAKSTGMKLMRRG